jgi:hypothetical protein
MTYRALGGLSDTLYRNHLFFGADFVERILYSAKSLGFEGGEDSNRGYLVTRPVNVCLRVIKSALLEKNDRSPVQIPPGRLSDNYRICCFVELILLEEGTARKAKHSLSLDGRGLG